VVVALTCRDGTRFDAVAQQLLGRIQEKFDLAEASERELSVVPAGERLEQRDALRRTSLSPRLRTSTGSASKRSAAWMS
jgi:hypothetical protein